MEKYGFVYIWYDQKHKRFYIGSHWGFEDDGYICSSNWMRDSYKRRPHDFKRRIISRIYTNQKELLEKEQQWLNLIPDKELGTHYYNFRRGGNGFSVGHKYSRKPKPTTIEYKQKMAEAAIGRIWWNNGETHKFSKNCPGPDFVKGRLTSWLKGNKHAKGAPVGNKYGLKNKASTGKRWYTNGESEIKVQLPDQLPKGFRPGRAPKFADTMKGNTYGLGKNLGNKNALGAKHSDEWKRQASLRMMGNKHAS